MGFISVYINLIFYENYAELNSNALDEFLKIEHISHILKKWFKIIHNFNILWCIYTNKHVAHPS